jgi:hypothetical protein
VLYSGPIRNVIPGLHVAALSVLLNYAGKELTLYFDVFTNALKIEDLFSEHDHCFITREVLGGFIKR